MIGATSGSIMSAGGGEGRAIGALSAEAAVGTTSGGVTGWAARLGAIASAHTETETALSARARGGRIR